MWACAVHLSDIGTDLGCNGLCHPPLTKQEYLSCFLMVMHQHKMTMSLGSQIAS